jgi:multidrug efflux pump subunit AcrA (membrane-fusion protein)
MTMRKQMGKLLLPLLAAGMLSFAVIQVVKAQQTLPKPPPPVEPARTPFGSTVAGAGIVEARSQNIAIGAPLPGVVLEVYGPHKDGMQPWDALVGERVKKGQPLFRVDDRQLKAQRAYYQAMLRAAQVQLDKLKAMPRPEELAVSKAKVETAQAAVEMQRDLAERAGRLITSRAIAEEDYKQRVLGTAMSQFQLRSAEKDLALTVAGAWKRDKVIARAAIAQAEAQVGQAQTDIDRCLVRAPVDGVVLQVNVRPGEYVGAPPSQALVVLGAIDKTVHVRVDIDEHDIPRFKAGAPARASLRGAPEKLYPLTFVRVEPYVIPKKSLTGDNTERVDTRVLQVIYALDVTGKPVYVGQQMDVFIDVGDKPAATAPAESQAD